MITPLCWLERVPTYKEQIENLKDRDLGTYGFLGYPLLQSADIVMYGEPGHDLLVPVGEDQVPHVELTREVVRKFNSHFGFEMKPALLAAQTPTRSCASPKKSRFPRTWPKTVCPTQKSCAATRGSSNSAPQKSASETFRKKSGEDAKFFASDAVLQEPGHMLTETPRLPGLDGRRMAKSYGNAIWLADPPDDIRTKVRNMMTDPQRVRRTDPGRPEICPVFAWHKLFSPPETIATSTRAAAPPASAASSAKAMMADNLVRWIEPVQAKRKEFEAQPQRVWDILDSGSDEARKAAERTMARVRNAIFQSEAARAQRPAVKQPPPKV